MWQLRAGVVNVLVCVLLWAALVLPNDVNEITPGSFVRIPVAGLIMVALILVLPSRMRRAVAILLGVSLAVLVLVKALDIGFTVVMDRTFHAMYDWPFLGAGFHILSDWIGLAWAVAVVAALVLVSVGVVVVLVRSLLRVSRIVSDHRRGSRRALTAAALVWALCAISGVQVSGSEVASTSSAQLVYDHATGLYTDYRDQRTFARAIDEDSFADTDGEDLLTGLRDKDVLLVFVESYGRTAVTDPEMAPQVNDVLEEGTTSLHEAGFSARSAFLTSPIVGGGSWLAHATLQSGLWVDSQQRYDKLLSQDRLTLASAFDRAGWRTPFVLPAVKDGWPEGRSFYGFDALHDARSLDYRGPELGWGDIPDQYTLSAFWRSVLAQPDRAPVMAEIDLVSSHNPWPPTPPLVDWSRVGDGSVFDCMPECGRLAADRQGTGDVRVRYRESIEYVLRTLVSFVVNHPDPDLVVLLVGDHQPWSSITGENPSHDVPITLIAHDPAVMRRISGWGWEPGMKPDARSPVWRMDTFRNRFLTAFGPAPGPSSPADSTG